MKISDIKVGEIFSIVGKPEMYMKINAGEDSWGNGFVAVDHLTGESFTDEEIPDETEVEIRKDAQFQKSFGIIEEFLRELSPEEQVKELRQFFINMMDWTEQSDAEQIYISLERFLGSIKI